MDIGALRQRVDELPAQQWTLTGWPRNATKCTVTRTIGLVFDPDFRHTHPTRLPILDVFHDAIDPALALVAGHYEDSTTSKALTERFGLGYFIRATLVRVKAGGAIDPHQNKNFSLTHSHRVHLPIVTTRRFSPAGSLQLSPGALSGLPAGHECPAAPIA